MPPLFLHCTWRTGSTYLFSKFRNDERNLCFQEPLHEIFSRSQRDGILSFRSEQLANVMHHPQLERPYFEEFVDLIDPRVGRIPWARERHTIREFFSPKDVRVERYLQSMLDLAKRRDRRAVLQFCRTYGRLPWLRRAFDVRHAYVFRAPRDQWMSCLSVGPEYFLPLFCVIAALRDQDYRKALSAKLTIPLPSRGWLFGWLYPIKIEKVLKRANAYVRQLTDADLYRIFYGEWLLAMRLGEKYCEDIVDMNRLSEDADYRRQVEEAWQVSLVDCRIPRYDTYRLSASEMLEIEAERSQSP